MNTDTAPSVVVGIDGSAAALEAALWAIDEAEHRDATLRLVSVVDDDEATDADGPATTFAQTAAKNAASAIEATGRPVRVDVSIVHGRPVEALLRASRSAILLCVGARGLRHATRGRIGSTAAALSAAAQCPVAIVRSHRTHGRRQRSVVVELPDRATAGALLDRGLQEAHRRGASVRILASSPRTPDNLAHWERRLAESRRRYPQLDISSVSCDSDALGYVAANADDVALMVTSRTRRGGVTELVGAPGNSALRDTDCSILICGPQTAL
ncbi:universal stress protein [Mycolicibacterium obuense]|uniref:Universal stress protein n=1 Tax=Mycolicibacterium obuense TaxID=1807 RepID=A0A0J6W3Z3_9MYCO|nr:universal stress protein [Mycolicibacterium obuense]KMO76483.1 Universal stress protein [Mycolicibacterium obuense]